MGFKGKVAIVTGGGTGIGAAVVKGLAREGANIAIISNEPVSATAPVRDLARDDGVDAEAYQCDVADLQQVVSVIDEIHGRFGRIDMLHHCAGIFGLNPVFESPADATDRIFDVNFKGAYHMIHSVLPCHEEMLVVVDIVIVASASGVLGQPPYSGYSASKAAVIRLVATIGPELKGTGIRINCIAPGATRTPMTAHVHTPQSGDRQTSLDALNSIIPSAYGQPWLEPADQANVMLFLASEEARGIQGQCIVVDQGLSAALPNL